MPDPSAPNLSLYRGLIVVLLLALVVTGWSLADMTAQVSEETPAAPAPVPAPQAAPAQQAPAQPAPQPGSAAVQVVDVATQIAEATRANADAPDQSFTFLNNRFGSVRVEVMSYTQIAPLHFHRMAHEAALLLSGDATIHAAPLAPQPLAQDAVIVTPPYSGVELRNTKSDEVAAIVVFATPPMARPADGLFYADEGDRRLTLGGGSTRHALGGGPETPTPLPLMGDKLSHASLTAPLEIAGERGGTVVWVVSGTGTTEGQPIGPHHLVYVPDGASTQIAPGEGPLGVLLFSPGKDGVSEILTKGTKKYSQLDEELVIRDFFDDREGGVFLDVGAGNYQRDSTTYYLEKHLGWSGIGVDALDELREGYVKNRPKTKFMNFLVTDEPSGKMKFYRANGYLEVSSASRKVASDQAAEYEGDGSVTELEVPSITLNELLTELGTESIDFLSMDIEEWEPAALRGFDIDKYKPELVCIEAHRSVQDELFAYFADHGYERLDQYLPWDRFNWYFTPKR